MLQSVIRLQAFVTEEMDKGIPANRIVIGGFSQGCVISVLV